MNAAQTQDLHAHRGAKPNGRTWAQTFLLLTIIATLLALAGCGGGEAQREARTDSRPQADFGSSSQFPIPSEIQPNVDFWRHVYGVWSRGQVAFHDDEHMDVIYEVAQVPGPIQEGDTAYQKNWISERKAMHQARVRELERRVTSNQPLSPDDKALLAKFERSGGRSALYGAAERVRSQRGLRERFRRGLEISGRYDRAFREAMRAKGVPEDLAYLPHVESSFQTNARSTVGAAGVWQFMPSTGRLYDMQVDNNLDERLDPILCADGAAQYLSDAHRKLRSWPLAITSYNHGVGGMAKAKAQHGDDIGRIVKGYKGNAFKFASRNFYSEFLAAREVARNAPKYFPEGVRYESPWPHDRVVLRGALPAHHVASHYGVPMASLVSLNLHFRDGAKSGRAQLPAGTTVWLPAGSTRRVGHPPAHSAAAPAMIARNEPKALRPAAAGAMDQERAEPRIAKTQAPKAKPEPAKERLAAVSPVKAAKAAKDTKPAKDQRIAKQAKDPKADKPVKEAKTKETKVAAKTSKGKPTEKIAKTPGKAEAKTTKVAAKGAPKVHTVKAKETLYRVATLNGISVEQLRKLNKLSPGDNSIRPGQKLKVGI